MYGKQTEIQDEIVEERLGLVNTNSSLNSNRKKFWLMGRYATTQNLLTEMRVGRLDHNFGVFPLFHYA